MIAFALWAAVGKPQQGKVLNGRPLKSSPARFIVQVVPSEIGTVNAYTITRSGRTLTVVATKSNFSASRPGRIPCQGRSSCSSSTPKSLTI